CLTLGSCNRPAESATSVPSANTFGARVFDVRVGESTERVNGTLVTSAFFPEAKVLPMIGRVFVAEEYRKADAHVVVLAASLWQRRFGGDPNTIGKTLNVNEQQFTIIGIMPKAFQVPTGAELWMPQNR